LVLAHRVTAEEVSEWAVSGVQTIAAAHDFSGRKDLNYTRDECREFLEQAAKEASSADRDRVDLLAALMSDAAIKEDKTEAIDATPLCLLFGQGHQHFLDRLVSVPNEPAPPPRGKGKRAIRLSPEDCISEALFQSWHRQDPTFSFRWDPEEDVRYALMAGDPTDPAYKPGTQHGANRLAAVGIAVLSLAPQKRRGRVRSAVVGGAWSQRGFEFAWPIWRDPLRLAAIKCLLSHPSLLAPGALRHLSVEFVQTSRRISVGKFMNFTRARPLSEQQADKPTSVANITMQR
jgi:hypothetical protein